LREGILWWAVLLIAANASADERAPVAVLHAIGTLHGFPSMSDGAGKVIADGELTQELSGDHLVVHARWLFADGRQADERDDFRVDRDVAQEHFSWIETRGSEELRRFEVDFGTGKAMAMTRDDHQHEKHEEAQLDLRGGRAFAGYGVALALSELSVPAGGDAEITAVGFTPQPRTVTLQVHRGNEEAVTVAQRAIPCDRYTLHPMIAFPVNLFAGVKDAHVWLTHAPPRALLRSEQNLVTKDDPVVIVDAMPRGAAHPPAGRIRQASPPSPSR